MVSVDGLHSSEQPCMKQLRATTNWETYNSFLFRLGRSKSVENSF